MSKQIKDLNIMIVEDEYKNTEILERILLNEGVEIIRTARNTEEAIEKIEKESPDLVLLDLKIPSTTGGIEDSYNSLQVIFLIQHLNTKYDHHIGVIIISGTTQDRGLQKLIAHDKSLIQHMFDKGLMGKNPGAFKEELMGQIKNTLKHPIKKEKPTISILDSYRNTLSYLKGRDQDLLDFLNSMIIKPYEEINGDSEGPIAQSIIVCCGMVVEQILDRFSINWSAIKGKKLPAFEGLKELIAAPAEDERTIGNKLLELSGRQWNPINKSINLIGNGKISRQACEYAQLAYTHRNYASHKGKADVKNKNIFIDNKFTKEHAAISISLIIPLIQDYIKYKSGTH